MTRSPRAAVLVVLVLACACGRAGTGDQRPVRAGDQAPRYGARSLAGDSVDLAGFHGTPVLVNLWATWCVPCRQELPALQILHERMGDSLAVVGVSIDGAGAADDVIGFLRDLNVDFPVWLDPDQRFVRRFRTVGVPETFLLDARGVVRRVWIGRFDPLDQGSLVAIQEMVGG